MLSLNLNVLEEDFDIDQNNKTVHVDFKRILGRKSPMMEQCFAETLAKLQETVTLSEIDLQKVQEVLENEILKRWLIARLEEIL